MSRLLDLLASPALGADALPDWSHFRTRRALRQSAWASEVSRSSTSYVRWVQASLNKIQRARLAVDGIFGSNTRSAVVAFQRRKRLGADGVVGPVTEAALVAAGAGQPPGSAAAPVPGPTAPAAPTPGGSGAAPKVTLNSGVVISPHAVDVLKGILSSAGLASATITSGRRTPADQARAMYNNLERFGVEDQKKLYGNSGDQVIDAYAAAKAAGKSSTQIQQAMVDKINAVGPTNISRHMNAAYDTFDVAPSTISDRPAFERALEAAKNAGRIDNYITPPLDPAYHIDIALQGGASELLEQLFDEAEFSYEAKSKNEIPPGKVLPEFTADSSLAKRVVPANECAVVRVGKHGSLQERVQGQITHVVIHTMEAAYGPVIEHWQAGGGDRCFKTHYAVRNDGEITQVVAEKHVPQHGHGTNPYSIGIEHDGSGKSPKFYTEAMYLASAALTRDICKRWNIAMDRSHIIGHDEAPGNCRAGGSCHGDPGGYWDWEYYLALVKWDGSSAKKPARVVLDTSSKEFVPSRAWKKVKPTSRPEHNPYWYHGWGESYYAAPPQAGADRSQSVFFRAVLPSSGQYTVSAWWPTLDGQGGRPLNNASTQMRVFQLGFPPTVLTPPALAQNQRTGRCRRTVALPCTPQWVAIGTLQGTANQLVLIEISRDSAARGQVVADAVRLLKV